MVDFQACSWPEPLNSTDTSLATHFDEMNQEPVADVMTALTAQAGGTDQRPPIITFSHFLPLQVNSGHRCCASQHARRESWA